MKFKIKVILICSAGYLGWLCPLTAILFAQQLDALHSFTTGNWLMSDLRRDAIQAIIPDFQVNENAGGSYKGTPTFGSDGNGNMMAVWSDDRNSYSSIYAQRFDTSGRPTGVNFVIEDAADNREQDGQKIVVKGNGDFVMAWVEWQENIRSGSDLQEQILTRMYDRNGNALSQRISVNDLNSLPVNRPVMAMDTSGVFMIAWQDQRFGNCDIFAQQFDRNGSPLSENFIVNDESGGPKQNLQIAAMGHGEFLVVWEDGRTGGNTSCIFAQRFHSLGTALGPNFLLIDSGGDINEISLAANPSGDAVIVWDEWHDADRELFAQRFHRSDTVISKGFKVNDLTMRRGFFNAEVAITLQGDFCVTWHGDEDGQDVIFAKWYDRIGTARGTQKRVNEEYGLAYHSFPSIFTDHDGNYIFGWVDLRNGQPDIYVQRYDSSANAQGANFKINDDAGSACQFNPDIAVSENGNFVVAWEDYRNASPKGGANHSDIYLKRYDPTGMPQGSDIKVNDNSTAYYIWNPQVAIAPADHFMVVWEKGASFADIYAQCYTAQGAPIGANILVSADTGRVSNSNYDIAVDSDGYFVIVWESSSSNKLNYYRGVFAQRYDPSSGIPIGETVKIAPGKSFTDVFMMPNGDFMVFWDKVSAQRYNSSGIPQGTKMQFDQSINIGAVTLDFNGHLLIVSDEPDLDNETKEIYARRYDQYGKAMGDIFKVNETTIYSFSASYSVVSDQNDNILIVWEDYFNGYWDIMAQRYNAQGQPLGGNFCPTQYTSLDQELPSAQVINGKIYLAWQTNHVGGTGYDIWANVLDWHSPVVDIEDIGYNNEPSTFSLSQNYPNPANPCTKIKYALPEREWVTIKIFDLSGREIRMLVHETQSQGSYEIVWDGKDAHGQSVASGIYFYQLKSGRHSAVKRMVLLR